MPCSGTTCTSDFCLDGYGFEFQNFEIINGDTHVAYEICDCVTPAISHINLQVCGSNVSPMVDVGKTLAANTLSGVSAVTILGPNQGGPFAVPFTSVKLDFTSGFFSPPECVVVTIVYDGAFSETQLEPGFFAVKAGNGSMMGFGLDLLLDCGAHPITCPDNCPDCTERVMPFTCEFTLPDLNCSPSFVDVVFEGFCPSLSCSVEQCRTAVELEVCPDQTIVCCITLDNLTVTGTIDVIFDVRADIGIDCLPHTVHKDFLCFETLNISQVCFRCPDSINCEDLNFCDLFDTEFSFTLIENVVQITGNVTFVCPPQA